MISLRAKLAFSLILLATAGSAQKLKKTDKLIIANLQTHISYLADDKLEGRRAGSPGEKLAMEYIAAQFKNLGLSPKGSDGFFQPFEIQEGKQIKEGTMFSVNGVALAKEKDFFPFSFSALKSIEGAPAIALQEAGEPWFVDLKEILIENQNNPHFDLNEYIRNNSRKAADRGATAVIIYNTSSTDDKLSFNAKDKSPLAPVPVVYVKGDAAKKFFNDATATLNIKLKVDIGEKNRTGHNVAAYLDNGAASTVVLGAHFDHLGYGEDNNSMLRTGEKLIHNGADDNASGTAAMLELARILKSSKDKSSNYLFLAFSGEELGLFGSKYYTENPTIDLKSVNYMINMDMVGRLNDSTKMLTVGGYGTSPEWSGVINPQDKKLQFGIKIDSSGSGPSDHTSFYRKDIPVLFFFTGQHKDYHRPTDDADRINYTGELYVINYIESIISKLNKQKTKLAFTKTRETQVSTSSFKVTMGIMPDYTYPGEGVRADGVTEGRPAAKAGLKTGDVIIQLGSHKVNSVETYMQALNSFNKGEKAKVKYKRGNQVMESEVVF
ncbi:M28 family peptidase [Terrimonas sp. NA20]|uniref:M28 family peptidase n=1 Tax=Terrimonas ginsenosidimutans TaxID=2908004 RepID=A0ABS9KL04_9BACT|nr:M20/M25/M40 family metallo-hydrolase [Terrimonas ginsenosidimutans]MCG2612986.1 M28 family peptidase [Terrimonas ginsenosidimutans]